MKIILYICLIFSFTPAFSQNTQINPGVLWNDIDGNPINAHGGCVIFENGLIIGLEKIVPDSFQTESVVINPQTYITGNGSAFL